jgi:hypothetical protein
MMIPQAGVDQLTTVISHATAPAFLLGAVAGFLSILITRAERVTDMQKAAQGDGAADIRGQDDLAGRMHILHGAIYFAVLSALATASLLVVAFVSAFLGIGHEIGMAILFTVALVLLMGSLIQLTRDVRVAMRTLPARPALTAPGSRRPPAGYAP